MAHHGTFESTFQLVLYQTEEALNQTGSPLFDALFKEYMCDGRSLIQNDETPPIAFCGGGNPDIGYHQSVKMVGMSGVCIVTIMTKY